MPGADAGTIPPGARFMIRKMILPALAALLLAGCASYQYRGGAGGDYYYGQPGTEYRYYGYPYGYGSFGYGGYGYSYPSYFSYGSYYGYPYGYGGYYRPPYSGPRPGHGHGHGGHHGGGGHSGGHQPGDNPDPPSSNAGQDRPTAPWRDLERLRERARTHDRNGRPARSETLRPQPVRSAPVRTQPVRTQPVRSQPVRSEPSVQTRSAPVRSTSQPARVRSFEQRMSRKRDSGRIPGR